MQHSSSANIPSLSSTCRATHISDSVPNGHHGAIKHPSNKPDTLSKATRKHASQKANDAAVQAAKREIRSKLHEDWVWPLPPNIDRGLENPDSINEWRERDSASSFSPSPPNSLTDPYKYESPDSLAQPAVSRKSKRKRKLEEEMTWNEGLKTYVERRDAWAGARTRPKSPSPLASPYEQPKTLANGTSSPPPSSETLVPIAPPILPPDNPIRAAISPAIYPSIYSKIIIQGLAPTVPINLKDVVNALVAGWKKDGEWPPKSDAEKAQTVEADAGGSRRTVRRSVGKVKKVLGLGHTEGSTGAEECRET